MDLDIANLTLKYFLQLRFYADPTFARTFRYDREDISRARKNEDLAARHGLSAEIENPLTGKPIGMREFLSWVLDEIKPIADALSMWDDLIPLVEMAQGGPNTAERLRLRLQKENRGSDEVPVSLIIDLAEDRKARVMKDIELIAERMTLLPGDVDKLEGFIQRARDTVHGDPSAPIRFRPRPQALVQGAFTDKTSEILNLAERLIHIPSVTACPVEKLDEVHRAATFIYDFLQNHGVPVKYLDGKYPAVYSSLPENSGNVPGGYGQVMLSGHFDVVPPEPDDSQFETRIEGDYLWGRGAADMKTVVATYLVWIKDRFRQGPPYPPISLLLVGNEENGEAEPVGTPHAMQHLVDIGLKLPKLFIAGERTEERGDELWGEVCIENRGVMRFDISARGVRAHSGVAGVQLDLTEKLFQIKQDVIALLMAHLTLQSEDGWQSQARFPFIQVGTPGIYNITPDSGLLGVEIRSIPADRLTPLVANLEKFCDERQLSLRVSVMEDGVACDPGLPELKLLLNSVEQQSGQKAKIGKKLPGTSARFRARWARHCMGSIWDRTTYQCRAPFYSKYPALL